MNNLKRLTLGLTVLLTINAGCNNSSDKSQAESSNNQKTNEQTMEESQLQKFGKRYAEAWCSQKPESVAAFFAKDGSLKVNNDAPAIGRAAITKIAEGFMTAFPDMIVSMDSLITTANGTEFHWTLTGTNTGPNGTGKRARVSGFELWQFDNDGLIKESIGSFDAEEYNQQLKYGVNN